MSIEEEKQENPKIRQTIFILSPTLSYTFDVNQTIQMHYLKRMISAAAHLQKNSFRIYYEGEDYTDYESEKLNELFPDIQTVTFTLMKGEAETLDKSFVEIINRNYCPLHEFKYFSYYCYTCKKSICSLCILGKEHINHKYKEKYDYLQNSKNLVDTAFNKNKIFTSDVKEEFKTSTELLFYKDKIKNIMFKLLHDLLYQIEGKITEIIDVYNKVNDISCKNLQDNIISIKDYCAKGLDHLKDEIGIHRIIIDENVFLTIDEKYKELYTIQSGRIEKDIEIFKELNSSIQSTIKELGEKTYKEIYTFLNGKLINPEYDIIIKKIKEKYINLLNEKEVINQITKTVNEKKSRPYSTLVGELSNAIRSQVSNTEQKITNFPINNIGSTPNQTYSSVRNIFQNTQNFSSEQNIKSPIISDIATQDLVAKKGGPDYIINPVKESNSIKILRKNNVFETLSVPFPFYVGITNFYKSSAHCNGRGLLYVSGGIEINGSNTSSSSFFYYDTQSNSIKRLTNMINPRHNHTMLYDDDSDFIYAIGGANLAECERFSIDTNQWTKLSPMNSMRQFPILYIYQNYLYAFFGKDENDKYIETVERLNLANQSSKWENVNYINTSKLNLRIYGCAVAELGGELIFFGGMKENSKSNSIFSFTFENNSFVIDEQMLEWSEYFMENKLIQVGDYFSQISEDSYTVVSLELLHSD